MEETMRSTCREQFRITPAVRCSMARRVVGRLVLLVSVLASVVPAASARTEYADPYGVAVIIGNRTYARTQDGDRRGRVIPTVEFAHRDADAFKRYVLDVLGFNPDNVVDLRDATQAQIEATFGNERSHQGKLWRFLHPRHGSDVVVFYSGHGVPGLKDKRGYLLPSDADPDNAEINGYPIDLLYENLGKLEAAKSVRVYLDACFSGDSDRGMLVRAASPVYVQAALPEAAGDKLTVLAAASGDEVASWDEEAKHGLFTHHLLDALYGKGDADGDGQVTAREAKVYLDDTMTLAARRRFGRLQNASLNGMAGMVLASAGAGGAFPARPELSSSSTASSSNDESTVADEASESPVRRRGGGDRQAGGGEGEAAELDACGQSAWCSKACWRRGLNVGVADGLFGPRTEAAILAYQKKKGLPETGELTREQADALMELGKESASGDGASRDNERREGATEFGPVRDCAGERAAPVGLGAARRGSVGEGGIPDTAGGGDGLTSARTVRMVRWNRWWSGRSRDWSRECG